MSYQVLTGKLCELEKRITKMQSCIQISESSNPQEIQAELESLKKEYVENVAALHNKLRYSRAEIISTLFNAYSEIEPVIRQTQEKIKEKAACYDDKERSSENKLLLAEYELDFCMLSIERALMVSLDAIVAQLIDSRSDI